MEDQITSTVSTKKLARDWYTQGSPNGRNTSTAYSSSQFGAIYCNILMPSSALPGEDAPLFANPEAGTQAVEKTKSLVNTEVSHYDIGSSSDAPIGRQASLPVPQLVDNKVPESLKWLGNPKLKYVLSIVPLLNGLAAVMYTTINHACSHLLGNGLWAALIAYALAMIATALSSLFKTNNSPIQAAKKVIARLKLNWKDFIVLTSGVFGSAYCVANTYIPGYIGSSCWFVFVVVGQVWTSMLFDRFGILWARKRRLMWLSYAGACIVVIGAAIFQMQGFIDMANGNTNIGKSLAYMFLTIFAGAMHVTQQSMVSEFNRTVHSTRYAVTWNYTLGTTLLLIIGCFTYPDWNNVTVVPSDWWKFCGGFFSLFGVLTCSIVGIFVGYNLTYCYVIFGQLITSLIFDNFGVLGTTVHKADAWRISGVVIVMMGVAVVQYGYHKCVQEYGTMQTVDTADLHTVVVGDKSVNDEPGCRRLSSDLSYAASSSTTFETRKTGHETPESS